MILITFKELIDNNMAAFISIIVAAAILLICLIILLVLKHKNKQKQAMDSDELLVLETLKENNREVEDKEETKTEVEESQPEENKEEPKETTVQKKKQPTKKVEPEKKTLRGRYEVLFDGEKYYYLLKASNGEVLIQSELYASKDSVLQAIEAVKRNIETGRVVISEDKRGKYQFSLIAGNNRKLVMSANYSSEQGALKASDSFKRFAGNSVVEEVKEASSVRELINPVYTDKKGGKLGVVLDGEQYFYILKASNGAILLRSDGYKTADLANNGLNTFKEAMENGKFYLEKDKKGYYQFKIYSQSGRIVAAGESYSNKANALSALNSLCSFFKSANPIE